jgi:hypothetical protein
LAQAKEENAFFWQYWVPGADAYITSNINPDIALVNGTPAKMHSLTLADDKSFENILQHAQMSNLPFGSEIEIDPPLAVNVEIVQMLDNKPLTGKRRKQLARLRQFSRQLNIDPRSSAIIIPLTAHMGDSEDWIDYKFSTGNPITPIAVVSILAPFIYDLAFSMTIHKAQGRTIKRVVIDLTDHPHMCCRMKYSAIFVAISRVCFKDHMRLLEPFTVQSREALYGYLETLVPDASIAPFLHGYQENNMPWNPDIAMKFIR